ncbi:dipeptide ABC transporter ATP-binding protein [Cyanobacterium sp. IPPAS B-1200]|uniref:dipeptide ABC transporter ATP-binding protein n=1 Tax=Cyanobacterium sp. IPPAS B-1200 TaxID=1562720 RepID=UPI00085268CB|nr:ABC transporter ATP-binding protein [Cyanobacterium sp. IPPAS B-1200]OEJ78265.1 ABC transporter ATP-binding protein [Cyanobacterium sp. IPPAS B-1200]
MNKSLLSIQNLKIAYKSNRQNDEKDINWAVNNVSFDLEKGEILALVGESGCGKSTIGKAIMGLLPAQTKIRGDIFFQGESIISYNYQQMRRFRGEAVGLVFQDPMTRLDPLMTIGEHCRETLKAHRPDLCYEEIKERVINTLELVKIPEKRVSQYPHEFSGGMRQRVAIALTLVLQPKLIIADEPTTSLDVTISNQILRELTTLCKEQEMGLILISHDLNMVGKYGDHIGVMYQGEMVETGTVKDVMGKPSHDYSKILLNSALHNQEKKESNLEIEKRKKISILKLKNLEKHYSLEVNFLEQLLGKKTEIIKAVDNINFELYEGEIFGLVGESGCGKSTLSRTILQLIKPTSGQVIFQEKDISILSPQSMLNVRREIQMIFQDPLACLNPLIPIGKAIAEPLIIHKLGNKTEIRSKVIQMLNKVGLCPPNDYLDRYPKELSGGQQQRVAIARALITNPKLVICDEPVSMLDATVQAQVLQLMLALKEEFKLTYLFITHDLSVARYMCDRIAVMNQGKIVELAITEEIFTNPQHSYTAQLINS